MARAFRIRRAAQGDAAELGLIERRCFTDPWSVHGIAETIQHETSICLVAESGPLIAGYLMARISGEEGEILNLAVLPEHRRQGVARALLLAGIEEFRTNGVREAYLEVRESNRAALALYAEQGFRPVGMRPHYYRNPPEDALVLRSPLRPLR